MWMDSCGFFFFKQKTAYEMRISDWSSDVCSSDLIGGGVGEPRQIGVAAQPDDVIEDEARVAHRRGILGHCSILIVSFAPASVRARRRNRSVSRSRRR